MSFRTRLHSICLQWRSSYEIINCKRGCYEIYAHSSPWHHGHHTWHAVGCVCRGGGGVTHHTTCYAPAFKKSVERGLFLDIRRRKASSTFLLKKGCFFPLYLHLGVLFRKVGFEGFWPLSTFSRGYNLKDWSSINFPFYMFIWCLIPCRAHLLTDNDI